MLFYLFNVESSFGRLGQPHCDRGAHRFHLRNVQASKCRDAKTQLSLSLLHQRYRSGKIVLDDGSDLVLNL